MSVITKCSLALLLAACSGQSDEPTAATDPQLDDIDYGDEEEDDSNYPACEVGVEMFLDVGTGGLAGFTPFVDGVSISPDTDASGTWGLYIDLLTAGLDTTEPITTVLRFSIGSDPTTQDAAARLALQCPNGGPGWAGVFAPLDDDMQSDEAIALLDGMPLYLTALMTDWTGATVATERVLMLTIP